jgi:hypothetical protein
MQGQSLLGSFQNPSGQHRHFSHTTLGQGTHSFHVKSVDLGKFISTGHVADIDAERVGLWTISSQSRS